MREASFFFPMSRALAPAIEVFAVQYPGRQDRRLEPNIDSLPELADLIVAALGPPTCESCQAATSTSSNRTRRWLTTFGGGFPRSVAADRAH